MDAKKRVLIIKLSALGDVIFNIPLANILKANGYEVSWLVGEKGVDIVKNNPSVDETIYVPMKEWKKQGLFKSIHEYLKLIKYLRAKKFDVALDTQLLFKSFIFTAFCGAKRRIVSKSAREFSILGGNEIIEKLVDNLNTHAVEKYLKYAKHLGLHTDKFDVTLPSATNETVEKISELLKILDHAKPVITIAPATTWATKHWDVNNWKRLVEKIDGKYNIVFTGTSNDIKLIEEISGGKYLNLAGKTNIPELCELFRRSDLVISLDSGSTHLAWATQAPKIVTIFCSTPTGFYAPYGSANKYIALTGNLACQPCHKKRCPQKTNECTHYPQVNEVFDAIEKLLG